MKTKIIIAAFMLACIKIMAMENSNEELENAKEEIGIIASGFDKPLLTYENSILEDKLDICYREVKSLLKQNTLLQ